VDQVDLPQVGLCRIDGDPGAVPHRPARMSVSLDAEIRQEPDHRDIRLAERMGGAAADGHDRGTFGHP
jgi:hypothetical protein